MKKSAVLICVAALTVAACAPATDTTGSASSSPTTSSPTTPAASAIPVAQPTVTATLASGLQAPWSVVPLSATSALISERGNATVLLLDQGQTTAIGQVPEAAPEGEGGLLGLAMPSPTAKQVYAYYTAATDNRISVFDFDGQQLSNERLVLGGIPKAGFHDGGRIAFGPDGFLYVATGDAGQRDLAQNKQSLAGKILRIRRNGNPAPGNPYPDSPVWSMGHRNVQGLAWDSQDQLWATEFGEKDVDELNLIEPGKNYGWPTCEGACDVDGMVNPKATWSPTSTSSPSGLAIVDDVAWIAALRGQALFEVRLSGKSASQPAAWFRNEYGRLRDVVQGPDDNIWMLTNNTDGRGQPKAQDDKLLAVAVPAAPVTG